MPSSFHVFSQILTGSQYPHLLLLQEVGSWNLTAERFFQTYGYQLVCSHLRPTPRGGVAILGHVASVLTTPTPLTLSDQRIEVCACHVALCSDDMPLFLGVASLYYPPPSAAHPDTPEGLASAITEMGEANIDLIAGDPNAWHPIWSTSVGATASKSRGNQIYHTVMSSDWSIATTKTPTRVAGSVESTPDVTLHRHHLSVRYKVINHTSTLQRVDFLQASDHFPISLNVLYGLYNPHPILHRCPQVCWSAVRDWHSVQKRWATLVPPRPLNRRNQPQEWARNIHRTFERVIKSLPRVSRRHHHHCPLNPELIHLREEISRAFRDETTSKTTVLQRYRKAIIQFHQEQEKRIMDDLTRTPIHDGAWSKKLWNIFHGAQLSPPPPLCDPNGAPLSARQQAHQFLAAFSKKHEERTNQPYTTYCIQLQTALSSLPPLPTIYIPNIDFPPISSCELRAALRFINDNQAADNMGIKPILLQHMPSEVEHLLCQGFTHFLKHSYVPDDWKQSVLLPLLKPDKPAGEVTSYRPVAITSLLCRLMEAILTRRIHHHLRKTPLSPKQMGFRRGMSIEFILTHILSCLVEGSRLAQKWQESANRATRMYARLLVAVDFSDAFCRVIPAKIEYVMRKRHLPSYLCSWVKEYLSGRTHKVWVSGRFSARAPCPLGCPQGSVLGPLLWLLAMDDLLDTLDDFRTSLQDILFPLTASGAPSTALTTSLHQTYLSLQEQNGDTCIPWSAQSLEVPKARLKAQFEFYAYADDLTFIVIAPCPRIAATLTQHILTLISLWATENGIEVSAKTQVRWISSVKGIPHSYPTKGVPLRLTPSLTIPIPPLHSPEADSIRILGLWVDPALSFLPHAKTIQQEVECILVRVNTSFPFMSPSVRSTLLQSTCHSRILFMLPVIWPSMTEIARGVFRNLWIAVARSITRCNLTTPVRSVLLTAGFRPLDHEVEKCRLRLLRRLYTLPSPSRELTLTPLCLTSSVRCRTSTQQGFRDIPSPIDTLCQLRTSVSLTERDPMELMQAFNRSRFYTTLQYNGQVLVKRDSDPATLTAFNLSQLSHTSSQWELWTDGSVQFGESSAGAYLIIHNGKEVHRGCTSLGQRACSYSAERTALRSGLEYLASPLSPLPSYGTSMVTYGAYNTARNTPATLRIVTDSLSTLKELEAGPFYQFEEETEEIWALASLLPVTTISWVFLFSHTTEGEQLPSDHPLHFHVVVDEYARQSLSSIMAPGRKPWILDILRPIYEKLENECDTSPEAQSTFQFIATESARPLPLHKLRLSNSWQRLLLQLRSGVTSRLPGSHHDTPEKCPFCPKLLGRLTVSQERNDVEHAVSHLFRCLGRPLPKQEWSAKELFTPCPLALLYFVQEFIDEGQRFG